MSSSPIIYPTSPSVIPIVTDLGQTPPLTTDVLSSTPRDTAWRSARHDIGTSRPLIHSDSPQPSGIERVRVVWGTNIVVRDTVALFRDFLKSFSHSHRQPNESDEPFYPRLLCQIRETELTFLNLDGENLRAYRPSRSLYRQLITYPQEIIPLMDVAVNEYMMELFPDHTHPEPIQVRPFNIGRTVNMRELSPNDIDQLIAIKGLVIRVSNIIPDMRTAFFQCTSCNTFINVENSRGKIIEPQRCPRIECNIAHSMVLIHNRCIYSDKQLLKVQETPDSVPDGQTPHAVTVCVYDSLVDVARAGDRVEITGIYRVSQVRINHRQRRIKNIFRTFIDVVHIKRTDSSRLSVVSDFLSSEDLMSTESDVLTFDEEIKNQDIIELSKTSDIYEKLANSIAPSIWQLDTVKKSVLLQLFGGISKGLKKFGSTHFRGDIHVLLAGDPSVSKSQLLQYVHKLAPRGIYTSGKSSSSVGLTAYITRDPETNQIVLESGALVLSDGGLCCIDEFDKMSDSTRAILHEVMEQQTVSVAKAGIITTLNARTSVLAAANPIDSKYNPTKSIVENINLPPSLLSRFDIICLILDQPDETNDIQLARHISSLHVAETHSNPKNSPPIDIHTLARYISYARQNIHPILSDEAIRPLLDGYVNMRKVNSGSTNNNSHLSKTVSATTRQLESLIRLSEAHARMRLSPIVQECDVQEAIRIVKNAILSYALDPITGKIDMDLINTGKSSAFRERVHELKKHVLQHIESQSSNSIEYFHLVKDIISSSSVQIHEKMIKQAISDLIEEETIYVHGPLRQNSIIRLLL